MIISCITGLSLPSLLYLYAYHKSFLLNLNSWRKLQNHVFCFWASLFLKCFHLEFKGQILSLRLNYLFEGTGLLVKLSDAKTGGEQQMAPAVRNYKLW